MKKELCNKDKKQVKKGRGFVCVCFYCREFYTDKKLKKAKEDLELFKKDLYEQV